MQNEKKKETTLPRTFFTYRSDKQKYNFCKLNSILHDDR